MGPSPTQDYPPNTPRSPLKQPSLSRDDILKEHNLSHLDVEYLKLQTALIRNRTQRNTLVSVGRLPPEILARIFSIRAMMDPSRISGAQRLGWIAVTHVCGHWRRVALACSGLWTDIRFDIGPQWTQKMFLRAKKAPLDLSLPPYLSPPLSDHQLDLIARHVHLGQKIKLNSGLSSLLSTLTSRPFPHLADFTIQPELDGQVYVMPHDFLGSCAPQLRRLQLRRTQVDWTAPVLSNLVELKVINPSHTLPRSTCADFLDALRSMSSLEHLELYNYPIQTHEPDHIVDIINMPRLTSLRIGDSLLSTAHLLNHLSLTPNVDIDLRLHLPSAATSTRPPPRSHLCQFFTSLNACVQCPGTPIWSLSLGSYYPWEFTVVATRGSADLYGRISITIDWGRRDAFDMVAAMCEGFGKNLDVLHVEMEEFTWSVAAWWSIIQAASNVRVLSVAGFAADVFCATLAIASAEPAPGEEIEGVPQRTLEHQYLPKLAVLRLVRARLVTKERGCWHHSRKTIDGLGSTATNNT
ncbi:hypothetical protein FA95DRAFT_303861 [Auriscalpium vulgare]|uniref:Uncharacterized protein n=1 Tax=Auriscalpium vulgare TaxID=40419 RepID=A0ACB8RKS3_9AGAM|nr:hypothetical protein FA95DRAFT_303861 [Auriscalpium vulgare]